MQIGKLELSERVEPILPALKRLFDFVKNNDFNALPLGKIEVDGDDIFIMNNNADAASEKERPLEMHRAYIDVHIPLDSKEKIGWKPTDEIEHFTQEYSAEGDCALSDDAPRYFVELVPGEYCIVFPEDAHAPAVGTGKIRKLIGKIKL